MGKKCEVCKKKCAGDIIKSDKSKYFHIGCFVCKACNKSLSETGYYTSSDGSLLCQDHYRALSTPLSIRAEQPIVYKQSDLPTPSLGSPTLCASCGDHLNNSQVLLALNRSWHVWCFKCSECSAVLQGEYMARNGKPFCLRDYNQKYGVKCYECERFIAGKVLEASNYKFHPTCARCSRCNDHFVDGQEMYMQGNEIWHPQCENYKTTENFNTPTKSKTNGDKPKYQAQLGQHSIYMYLLPEAEQTNLNHPIAPHPQQPTQFHTPQGPIKIRKSRLAMLKTGMQRLTEDLEKNTLRAKSPHMDNEEPIELAHYPNAQVPDPYEVPPIERENFPAPPYPYAIEEVRKRLSSSSIENDYNNETDEDDSLRCELSEEKIKKRVQALHNIDKDSSIAAVIKQNLEENQKKQRLPLYWDPRNASRTPSAKKMPHLKFRYDVPINASPSRHLNRPKPWMLWKNGNNDRAATTTIPCFHLPQSKENTFRAATLPGGYCYGDGNDLSATLSTHYSDHSLNAYTTFSSQNGKDFSRNNDMRTNLRTSLPDMSKPVNIYSLDQLQTTNKDLPEEVDRQHLERHLAREEFEKLFEMTPIEFYKLPEWKRINLKRKVKLF